MRSRCDDRNRPPLIQNRKVPSSTHPNTQTHDSSPRCNPSSISPMHLLPLPSHPQLLLHPIQVQVSLRRPSERAPQRREGNRQQMAVPSSTGPSRLGLAAACDIKDRLQKGQVAHQRERRRQLRQRRRPGEAMRGEVRRQRQQLQHRRPLVLLLL